MVSVRARVICGAVLVMLSTPGCHPPNPVYWSGQHENDTIAWHGPRSKEILLIMCPSGIGQLQLHSERTWPDSLVVGLQLKGLENFAVTADGQHYRIEVTRENRIVLEPVIGNPLSLVRAGPNDAAGAYLVRIDTRSLAAAGSAMTLSWVDFYR